MQDLAVFDFNELDDDAANVTAKARPTSRKADRLTPGKGQAKAKVKVVTGRPKRTTSSYGLCLKEQSSPKISEGSPVQSPNPGTAGGYLFNNLCGPEHFHSPRRDSTKSLRRPLTELEKERTPPPISGKAIKNGSGSSPTRTLSDSPQSPRIGSPTKARQGCSVNNPVDLSDEEEILTQGDTQESPYPSQLCGIISQASPASQALKEPEVSVYGDKCWLGGAPEGRWELALGSQSTVLSLPEARGTGKRGVQLIWDLCDVEHMHFNHKAIKDSPDTTLTVVVKVKTCPRRSVLRHLDLNSSDAWRSSIVLKVDPKDWKEKLSSMQRLTASLKLLQPLWSEEDERTFSSPPAPLESPANFRSGLRSGGKPPIKPFFYPREDADAVSISNSDVERLEPVEFLNDTLIDFYIKYLQEKMLSPEECKRFYFFNSFFFKKLQEVEKQASSKRQSKEDPYARVQKWTREVDIFQKDYLFIPVNQSLHWSLAIICHPGLTILQSGLRSRVAVQQEPDRTPCILHLNSLPSTHSNVDHQIRVYLSKVWAAKHPEEPQSRGTLDRFSPESMPLYKAKVPAQDNHCDCGVFLLHYVELFCKAAPKNFSMKVAWGFPYMLTKDWFAPSEVTAKREEIKKLIHNLASSQPLMKPHLSSHSKPKPQPLKDSTPKPERAMVERIPVPSTLDLRDSDGGQFQEPKFQSSTQREVHQGKVLQQPRAQSSILGVQFTRRKPKPSPGRTPLEKHLLTEGIRQAETELQQTMTPSMLKSHHGKRFIGAAASAKLMQQCKEATRKACGNARRHGSPIPEQSKRSRTMKSAFEFDEDSGSEDLAI